MNQSVNIVITGDLVPGIGRVKELAIRKDVKGLFGPFSELIKSSDLAITNLESPLIEGGTPIPKTGPNIKSAPELVEVFYEAGFNLATLANNHIMDYGPEGLVSTMKACKLAGIDTVGAAKNRELAQKPFVKSYHGLTVAVVNIAENEFGTTDEDGPGAHPLDPVQNFYAIRSAGEIADKVIVIVHGGHEHYELPSPRMKQTYRFFADAGADAVIGHHTHCVSGYEIYREVPIFYSIGNFLFDKAVSNGSSVTPWNEGILLELDVTQDKTGFQLHPFIQNGAEAGLRKLTGAEEERFFQRIELLNQVIRDDQQLQERFDAYCRESYRLYSSYIEPHSVRILHALRNRNLLPSVLTERKKRLLLNLTRCEAHRDVLIKTLRS